MTTKFKFSIFIMCFCSLFVGATDINTINFKKESKQNIAPPPEEIQELAQEKIEMFTNLVLRVATTPSDGSDASKEMKEWTIDQVISLFTEDAVVETSNKNNDIKNDWPISKYMNDIVGNYSNRYQVLVMEFEAVTAFDNWEEKTDKNGKVYYEGKFSYTQRFCGKKIGGEIKSFEIEEVKTPKFDYCDTTIKEGKAIVYSYQTFNGVIWQLKLDDIKVLQTF